MIHIWAYQNGKGPTRIKVTEVEFIILKEDRCYCYVRDGGGGGLKLRMEV